jgi:hypothetical protein
MLSNSESQSGSGFQNNQASTPPPIFGRTNPDDDAKSWLEDAQVRHPAFAQDVPNTENRHIRLVGQPVTLSQTPSGMAARPTVSVDDFANCNSDSD